MIVWRTRKLRVLDLDVECLPGHWIGGDFVSKIITAVGWKWLDEPGVTVLTHYEDSPELMASQAAAVIARADIVVGHYIRAFDLKLINGNLLRGGHPPMMEVLTHDTKLDLYKTHGRSLSQKNLAAQVGCRKPKVDVTLDDWERFNLRIPGFREKGAARVKGDVLQNIEMREKLLKLGWLGPPKVWTALSRTARYAG